MKVILKQDVKGIGKKDEILRGQVLNDMKGEELSEALTAYGASLEHNLSSSAMNRMPASKIVNSSTN